MKKIFAALEKVQLPDWSLPLGLLSVCIISYGFLLPRLGFFQDDWHFIYYAYTRGGTGLAELLNYDGHPLAAIFYNFIFKLLGFYPLNWQIFALFCRWMAVSAFWLVLHSTWPTHRRFTFTAAAIYIIYPLYTLQSQAVIFCEVWVGHFLLAISFLFTIYAIKQPKRFWVFITLAIIFKMIQTFTREFSWGLELARPFLIFFALPVIGDGNIKKRLITTFKIFLPFLIITGLVFTWRGLIYTSPVLSRSEPKLFNNILADPVGGIKYLVLNTIPDLVQILFSTWFQILDPKFFSFADGFNLKILGLVIFSATALFLFLSKLQGPAGYGGSKHNWLWQPFVFGSAALIFGLIPAYAVGYFVHLKLSPWNGRFAIGSMPGIALLFAIFLEFIFDSPRKRIITTAIILSLGLGWQIRNTNEFRSAWSAEINFYRQLIIRAPHLAPHTAFLAELEFLGLMGDYPTSFALNTIYATPGDQMSREAKTWLFVVATNFKGRTEGLLSDITLEETKHSTHFIGKSSDSLVVYYEPDLGQCLWIITPENSDTLLVPKTLQEIDTLTNLNLIMKSGAPAPFLQYILPPQPDDWCSYYQRGSLAYQFGEWDKAVSLWEQADKKNLHPANGFEFLPFIESYGHQERWEAAFTLTKNSDKTSRGMANVLCSTWRRLQEQTTETNERDIIIDRAFGWLDCR